MENQQTRRPTTLETAQELHRIYNLALGKTRLAWPYMTEVAAVWEELGEERQQFFIQFAKEIRREQ